MRHEVPAAKQMLICMGDVTLYGVVFGSCVAIIEISTFVGDAAYIELLTMIVAFFSYWATPLLFGERRTLMMILLNVKLVKKGRPIKLGLAWIRVVLFPVVLMPVGLVLTVNFLFKKHLPYDVLFGVSMIPEPIGRCSQ